MSPKDLTEVASSAIPVGYKQTEVGVIPEDWDVVPIGSLCTIFGRIGFRGYTKSDIVDEDQGVLSISPSNILHGTVSFDHGTYISWSKYHESPEIQIFNGDVLLVKTGSTYGKVGLVNSLDREATLNPQVVVLKKIKCPSSLLAYVMQFELVQNQIEETIVGGAIPTLSQKAVANYLVPIPIKQSEQTAIANALSDVDALISELDKLIAKKQAIKTATMQQLLTGRTRLPQFALREDGTPKGTKPSELGEIPEDWEVDLLRSVCDSFKTGKLDANAMKPDGEYRFYTCAKEYYYIDRYAFDEEALMVSGNGANVGYVHYYKGKFNAYQRTYVLSNFIADVIYLKIYLERKLAERIRVEVNAGNTPYITMDTLTDMPIVLPPKEEQTAIATILSDMDAEIQALEQRLGKTRQIKQGMMQELLTGKTRLIKPSKEVIHE